MFVEMKSHILFTALLVIATLTTFSCSSDMSDMNEYVLFPDYRDVTIPYNIAPMNFSVSGSGKYRLVISDGKDSVFVNARNGTFHIPFGKWRALTEESRGMSLSFSIYRKERREMAFCESFEMHVAQDPADPYIAYRLIPPGYTGWKEMGIYQRCIENFTQSEIISNRLTDGNCMNCHSFCMQNPDRMLFHTRAVHAGTILADRNGIEKIDTGTPETVSPLVYPSWHPGGRYVAFSNNVTHQSFFLNNPGRIEVYDDSSDVVVYDSVDHKIFSVTSLKSSEAFETFPAFSPDGCSLFFCSAHAVDSVREHYREIHYNLCRIGFDEVSGCFNSIVDTVFDAASLNASVSFPRVSPDGSYLLFTVHSFGNFPIWHRDADLWCIDLARNVPYPLSEANSEESESYHSWSHNSRWIVFSSRRVNGLYTMPYFAYFSKDGTVSKPFLLPQRNPREYYDRLQFSFNIPEFITGKVDIRKRSIVDGIMRSQGEKVSFEWRCDL